MATSTHDPALPEAALVAVRYEVPVVADDWVLPEVPVPESVPHRATAALLAQLWRAWVERTGRSALVAENLAYRWTERRPRIGIDPDVCLIEPAPPDQDSLKSLLLWRAGHSAPRLAVEVVSENHPYKDYDVVPDRYAASGVGELWVFDPELRGPRKRGGPHRLQLWAREEDGSFVRHFAGDGPVHSAALDAWAFVTEDGDRLRIADDEALTRRWLTIEEEARASEQRALARIAELEAELARRGR